MTVQVFGELSIGGLFSALPTLLAGVQAQIDADLTAARSAALEISVELPTITAAISAAADVSAELAADLSIGGGGFEFDANIEADVIAELTGYLRLIAEFLLAFGSATAEVFIAFGTAAEVAAECSAEISGGVQGGLPTDQCQAIVMVTRFPAFIASFIQLMEVA